MDSPEDTTAGGSATPSNAGGWIPRIHLDHAGLTPLLRQLEIGIGEAIRDGRLQPGTRLPATRGLAKDLGISRMTVAASYERLRADGLIQSRRGSGTFVSDPIPYGLAGHRVGSTPSPTGGGGADPIAASTPEWFCASDFPYRAWSGVAFRAASEPMRPGRLRSRELRTSISDHLAHTRGIDADPDRILVTDRFRSALRRGVSVAAHTTSNVGITEPAPPHVRSLLATLRRTTFSAGSDAEGVIVREWTDVLPAESVVVLSATRPFPLGLPLSEGRRSELLEWATRTGSWVVEDDQDGEFFTGGKAYRPLAADDRSGRVVHVGSLDRLFYPSARFGYVLLPEALWVKGTKETWGPDDDEAGSRPSPTVEDTVTEFLRAGHGLRQIRRLRKRYSKRRAAFVDGIAASASAVGVELQPSGLHTVLWMPPGYSDTAVCAALETALPVRPVSDFYASTPAQQGLIVAHSGLLDRVITEAGVELGRQLNGAMRASQGH